MKIGTFQLQQCPEWLPEKQAMDWEIQQVQKAEGMGFDSVWIAEHHFSRHGICGDPLVLAAYLAAKTSRVRVGLAVSILPLHNPLYLAEQGALVDILSNGRLNFGVGRGYQMYEFDRLGVSMSESRERFNECLDIILKAWTQDNFSYDGKFWKFPELTVYPKPIQKPHPPIFVATSGTPETLQYCGRMGYPFVQGGVFTGYGSIKERYDVYTKAAREAGHSEERVRQMLDNSALSRRVYVATSEKQAREDIEKPIMWGHRTLLSLALPRSEADLQLEQYRFQRARMAERAKLTFDDLYKQDIFGTPEQCIKRIGELRSEGVRNFLCWFTFGGLPNDKVFKSMDMFAKEVLPHFQD